MPLGTTVQTVPVFNDVMNAPSVLERKGHGDLPCAHTLKIGANREGVGGGTLRCDRLWNILTVLPPEPTALIAGRKRRKIRKSLIPECSIVRGKWEKN